jgi:hypothetical protein
LIIVVGETANRNFEREYTFEELLAEGAFVSGPSRQRLLSFGVPLDHSLNLCSPGRWDPDEAIVNARAAIELAARESRGLDKPSTVLAFGQRCSNAFGMPFRPGVAEWRHGGWVRLISCAHPSGLSRWWNNETNVENFRRLITEARIHL